MLGLIQRSATARWEPERRLSGVGVGTPLFGLAGDSTVEPGASWLYLEERYPTLLENDARALVVLESAQVGYLSGRERSAVGQGLGEVG